METREKGGGGVGFFRGKRGKRNGERKKIVRRWEESFEFEMKS